MTPACRSRRVSQSQKSRASIQLTRAAGRPELGDDCPSDRLNCAKCQSCVSTQAMRTGRPPATGTGTNSMPRLFLHAPTRGAGFDVQAVAVTKASARKARCRMAGSRNTR
jgi:hypothetical protein